MKKFTTKGVSYIRNYKKQPTAGALVIADEVLNGKVLDTNSNFLSKSVKLRQISVIPDDEKIIIDHAQKFSKEYDFVFTSGGIGPTHDDITYESLGKAFNRKVSYHQETIEKMKISYAKINKELNSERLRMALIPENIEAFWTPDLWVPLVKLENIYILPGIPELYQKMLNHNIDNILANKGIKFERCLIYTDLPEGDFSEELRNIAKSHPNINIGSYPSFKPTSPYKVYISIEGEGGQEFNDVIPKIEKCVQGRFTKISNEKQQVIDSIFNKIL